MWLSVSAISAQPQSFCPLAALTAKKRAAVQFVPRRDSSEKGMIYGNCHRKSSVNAAPLVRFFQPIWMLPEYKDPPAISFPDAFRCCSGRPRKAGRSIGNHARLLSGTCTPMQSETRPTKFQIVLWRIVRRGACVRWFPRLSLSALWLSSRRRKYVSLLLSRLGCHGRWPPNESLVLLPSPWDTPSA